LLSPAVDSFSQNRQPSKSCPGPRALPCTAAGPRFPERSEDADSGRDSGGYALHPPRPDRTLSRPTHAHPPQSPLAAATAAASEPKDGRARKGRTWKGRQTEAAMTQSKGEGPVRPDLRYKRAVRHRGSRARRAWWLGRRGRVAGTTVVLITCCWLGLAAGLHVVVAEWKPVSGRRARSVRTYGRAIGSGQSRCDTVISALVARSVREQLGLQVFIA
jgi:hypothetical protein